MYTHTEKIKYPEPDVAMVNFYMWVATLSENWYLLAQFVCAVCL